MLKKNQYCVADPLLERMGEVIDHNPLHILKYFSGVGSLSDMPSAADFPKAISHIQFFAGDDAVPSFLDTVYFNAKKQGTDVILSGIQEQKFYDYAADPTHHFIRRRKASGIGERILLDPEEGVYFPELNYRLTPKNLFKPLPSYIFGNHVGVLLWAEKPGENHRAIAIESKFLAQSYRQRILSLWERAQPVN